MWASAFVADTAAALLHLIEGRVVDANEAARELLGDAIFGMRLAAVVPSLAGVRTSATHSDVPAVGRDGKTLRVDAHVTALTGRPGQLVLRLTPHAPPPVPEPEAPTSWTRLAAVLEGLAAQAAGDADVGMPGLVLVDLDRFRQINEIHGRLAGDEALRVIGGRLEESLQPGQTLVHLDTDQFAVVGPTADLEALGHMGRRTARAIQRPIILGPATVHITASLGAAAVPLELRHDLSVERIVADAEIALRTAKSQGRGQLVVFDEARRAAASHRMDLEAALIGALGRNELFLEFQPLVDLASARPIGAEALLRWEHPRFGLVPPAGFLDVAESAGLIDAIGMWVVQEALRAVAGWPEPLVVSVNVSALQLRTPGFARMVDVALRRAAVPPARLHLELTESILVEVSEVPLQEIAALRSMGVEVGIDDFGTGYASMAYLKHLPVDFVKIDREFVWGLDEGPVDRAIVTSTLRLAEALGVRTIAEGVETEQQRDALLELGCGLAQGYLFARPRRAELLDADVFAPALQPTAG